MSDGAELGLAGAGLVIIVFVLIFVGRWLCNKISCC